MKERQKSTMSRECNLLITLIGIMLLTSCQLFSRPLPALVDSVCEPPCWQNIIPGHTPKEEIISLASDIPGIDPDEMGLRWPWKYYSDSFYGGFVDSDTILEIYFIDDVVSEVFIIYDLGLRVDDTIGVFGEPETVVLGFNETAPYKILNVHLLYPTNGIVITFESKDIEYGTIRPEIMIDAVLFLDPDRLKYPPTSALSLFSEESDQMNRYPWEGYKDYPVKYIEPVH